MIIERTKNATRNIVFGFLLKIYQMILPFLMRTAMIYFMGIQYLGLNGLFTSILQVLNLAELGVGSAMVFSMYKPIIEDDTKKICALMNLYRIYYRIIGLVIAITGIILTPFIPYLIKGSLPSELNIYVLYYLNLATTVMTYWLYSYKNCLLTAHQREDVISKVGLFINSVQFIFQLLVVIVLKNYYIYLITALLSQINSNLITAYKVTKMFPKYKPVGKLDISEKRTINGRIRDLFTSKIGSVIVNSSDSIVISAFLGLTVLAIYQNYYFILTSVIGVVTIVFNACMAGIGNSLIVENNRKNFQDFSTFTMIVAWISCICTSCFLCLFQPFMKIWVGEDLMLGFSAVIMFCIYYFIYEFNQLFNMYKDAAGIWHEDRFRPLITAFTNLTLNIIMVQFIGIYGVLLSTIISMLFVGIPWILHNLFTTIFERKYLKIYLKKIIVYIFVTIICCVLCHFTGLIFNISNAYLILIIRLIICLTLPNVLMFSLFNRIPEFKHLISLVDRMTGYKLKLKEHFYDEE